MNEYVELMTLMSNYDDLLNFVGPTFESLVPKMATLYVPEFNVFYIAVKINVLAKKRSML